MYKNMVTQIESVIMEKHVELFGTSYIEAVMNWNHLSEAHGISDINKITEELECKEMHCAPMQRHRGRQHARKGRTLYELEYEYQTNPNFNDNMKLILKIQQHYQNELDTIHYNMFHQIKVVTEKYVDNNRDIKYNKSTSNVYQNVGDYDNSNEDGDSQTVEMAIINADTILSHPENDMSEDIKVVNLILDVVKFGMIKLWIFLRILGKCILRVNIFRSTLKMLINAYYTFFGKTKFLHCYFHPILRLTTTLTI